MDNFYEQLVTTKKTGLYNAANVGTYLMGFIGLMMLSTRMMIPAVVVIAISLGLFFSKKKLYVEHEYHITNTDIDIDAIYEMRARKRIISFNVKDMELLAPVNSDPVKSFSNKPEKVYKLYPSTSTEKIYAAMVTGGTTRAQILFVPNERFIEMCYKHNPRAVKKFL